MMKGTLVVGGHEFEVVFIGEAPGLGPEGFLAKLEGKEVEATITDGKALAELLTGAPKPSRSLREPEPRKSHWHRKTFGRWA